MNPFCEYRGSRRKPGGFTLLEMLLALALVGLLLVGLNTFIFSMGELWGRNSDARLFEQHTRAVTRFLAEQLRQASLPPAGTGNNPITVEEVRVSTGATENLLTFELLQGSRVIPWPDQPLPEVLCSLQWREREGLVLLWRSRLETRFLEDPPHETVISPLVSEVLYDYYDADFKNWKTETALQRGEDDEFLVPQRLRLKFTYGGRTREMLVAVPMVTEGLPVF